MKRYYLSSVGFLILSITIAFLMSLLTILCFFGDNFDFIMIMLGFLLSIFFYFNIFICVNHKIVIKDHYLII